MKSDFLNRQVIPFEIKEDLDIADLLEKMEHISFQGRRLASAFQIWKGMLEVPCTIFFGLAGAMVPAGMRKIVTYLMEHHYIDCLVSTGANLFHSIHENRGKHHFQGNPETDDIELHKAGIDRIYDTYASEEEFRKTEDFVEKFAAELPTDHAYSTREFLYLLGKKIAENFNDPGPLDTAARECIPVYCPALGDSSIGIALAVGRIKGTNQIAFDIVKDVVEMAKIFDESRDTGVVYVGGGTPKNFIQQASVTSSKALDDMRGHRFAVQIITDSPHWGGLSGCTFDEARSWGKIADNAESITVHSDATIALPILVSALASSKIQRNQNHCPRFNINNPSLTFSFPT